MAKLQMFDDRNSQDVVNVLFFLFQAEREDEIWLGIKAQDAFESACRMLNVNPVAIRLKFKELHP